MTRTRSVNEIARACVRAWYENAGENGEDWNALEAVIREVIREVKAETRAAALEEAADTVESSIIAIRDGTGPLSAVIYARTELARRVRAMRRVGALAAGLLVVSGAALVSLLLAAVARAWSGW